MGLRICFVTNLADEVLMRASLVKAFESAGHEVTSCVSTSSSPESLAACRRLLPCHVCDLDRAGLNPIADARYAHQVFRHLSTLKPDVVFNRAPKPVIYGSLAACVARVQATYSMISGLGYAFAAGGKRKLLRTSLLMLYRASLSSNRAVFFQNTHDMELFVGSGIVKSEQAVLLNGAGVDLERFSFAEVRADSLTFLFLGRLLRDKGIFVFVDAARIIRAKFPSARFILLGANDANPSSVSCEVLQSWVDEGILEWRKPVADVRPVIAEASVVVLPSFGGEGSPRGVLEAMAVGRAVITTPVAGCKDTVIPGLNGFLVTPGDSEELAAAMERLCLNPELLYGFGRASRALACERFDVRQVNRRILEVVESRRSSGGRKTVVGHGPSRLAGKGVSCLE
jgi:glycosyltransferase involved in cell wall biosynthesis